MFDQRLAKIAIEKFSLYYRKADIKIPEIEKKEFGFGDFERRIINRHISFNSNEQFKNYLLQNKPASISISTAFYKYPNARPMEKKGWLGSELVFDLDSSDLRLDCQLKHGRSWVCENCLNEVKNETFKLIEGFLVPDFSISKEDISINFSGNRGYHVHIADKRFYELNSNERRQISDYITARGLNLNIFFPNLSEKKKQLRGPKPDDPGWGGKLARSIISYLNSDEKKLEKLNVERKIARKLLKNKAEIIMGISVGNWDKIDIPKKDEFWTSLLNNVAVAQTSMIDKNVTSGAEHLIRLPSSIHSDTALMAKPVASVNSLEKFDPMKEAVLFKKGALKVHVEKSEVLSINGETFGPYEKQDVELPTYAALYLLLKGVATLAD